MSYGNHLKTFLILKKLDCDENKYISALNGIRMLTKIFEKIVHMWLGFECKKNCMNMGKKKQLF